MKGDLLSFTIPPSLKWNIFPNKGAAKDAAKGAKNAICIYNYYRKNNYVLKEGLDQSGATIDPPGALSNIEVSTCQRICDAKPNCSGIVYRPSDKVCWNVTGFNANQVKDDRYQSYHKNPNITESFSNDGDS